MDKPQIDLRIEPSKKAEMLLELLQREINEHGLDVPTADGSPLAEFKPTDMARMLQELLMKEVQRNMRVIMIFSGGDSLSLGYFFNDDEMEIPF